MKLKSQQANMLTEELHKYRVGALKENLVIISGKRNMNGWQYWFLSNMCDLLPKEHLGLGM